MVRREMQKEAQDKALIQEMINDAERAEEPGDKPGSVISRGDTPAVIKSIESAGYAWIWDTRTGEKSKTNMNMLPTQLKKEREDGSKVFTTRDPGIVPFRGKLKCHLHPDDPQRQHYKEMGFGVCKKANLVSEFQREEHMKKKHRAEYATMERERVQKERDEDRAFQRNLLKKA